MPADTLKRRFVVEIKLLAKKRHYSDLKVRQLLLDQFLQVPRIAFASAIKIKKYKTA